MSIEARPLRDAETWNRVVERSATPTSPLHRYEALEVLADHGGCELVPLVGYKGQEAVGGFPLFVTNRGPVTAAFSPPPRLKVEGLGPFVAFAGQPKRRKRDSQHRRFVRACLGYLDEEYAPKITHVRTQPGYDDTRPYSWDGYDVTPRYTYVVDLGEDPDALLDRFSSDARRNITNEYEVAYTIERGTADDIADIVAQLTERHREQGEPFPPTTAFVTDLYEALPDGELVPYVCHVEGEFAGGVLVLRNDEAAYAWMGGAKTDGDLPVNDLVDWQVCLDCFEDGVGRYDLVGANNERLCSYKAKFAPDLVPYFRVERHAPGMKTALKLYDRLQ